jgi:hypothetical protein
LRGALCFKDLLFRSILSYSIPARFAPNPIVFS